MKKCLQRLLACVLLCTCLAACALVSPAAAASTAPTKEEYDALVGAYNDLAKRVNALVAGLVAAGVVKTS